MLGADLLVERPALGVLGLAGLGGRLGSSAARLWFEVGLAHAGPLRTATKRTRVITAHRYKGSNVVPPKRPL